MRFLRIFFSYAMTILDIKTLPQTVRALQRKPMLGILLWNLITSLDNHVAISARDAAADHCCSNSLSTKYSVNPNLSAPSPSFF